MDEIEFIPDESHIEKLEGILGNRWIKSKLAEYKKFREQYSPMDLWSHRFPTTSPIVPLLFQYNYPESRRSQGDPFGYWYGDPVGFLSLIASAIYLFEDYWSSLPNYNGEKNIRSKLSKADQFNGFIFELLVALDSRLNKYKDYDIEPLFFNPDTIEGGADIVLRKGNTKKAIQCKTRSPLAASQMSFDAFQYLFGCLYRLVCNSGYSYKLTIELKRKLKIADVQELLSVIEPAVRNDLCIPRHTRESSYSIELSRLSIPLRGLNKTEISNILKKDKANLFAEVGGLKSNGGKVATFNRIAVCSVSASRYESVEDSVLRIAKQTAKEARVDCPLTIAIHLYGNIKLENYFTNSSDRKRLQHKLDSFFLFQRGIEYVNVSSNRQKYVSSSDRSGRIVKFLTQYMEISNPYFTANPS